jgi:hypothetical protein
MSVIPQQFACDSQGCEAVRRQVNRWYVVLADECGVHVFEWDKAPAKAMANGKHFCGIAHTVLYVSIVLTPDTADVNREATIELKPPLTREGTKPADISEPIQEEKE